MYFNLILVILIYSLLFIKIYCASYSCKGGNRGISSTECQRSGRVFVCRERVAGSNLGELMGCEGDGTGRYWCCLQYCPDQKTIIYYKNYQIGTNVETATQRCTGTGINAKCLSNSNDICFKPIADFFPTNFEYCCPPTTDQGGNEIKLFKLN
ncbi:hypothetical protein Mgra_00008690 [Meloidogyne graminicola]|uniref:Uncharacterized protein n=1 Tax=Meloidogyne graminicola TaxID=189291 RepID=A0A8S9ZF37_9BILA|nr:hypothetical protein Mgra_00008690 [Meloidogyne graminicola]